jgi:hypothetical protein
MATTTIEKQFDESLPYWTKAAIEDELTFRLSSAKSFMVNEDTGEIHITYKYHDYAQLFLYRLNTWVPRPVFVINLSDLSMELKLQLKELKRLPTPTVLDEVVTSAIGRILESVNERYYHLSGAMGKIIEWRFEP